MEIPSYPASRPLELSDKHVLDRLLKEMQPRMSELTFAGLFLFRHAHEYRVSQLFNSVVISATGYDGIPYVLPPLGGNAGQTSEHLLDNGITMYCSDHELANWHLDTQRIESIELRNSFDYLYLRSELAELPGSKFHKKKNRISYFTNRHQYTVEQFTAQHSDSCQQLLNRWALSYGEPENASLHKEITATAEALQFAEQLGLSGIIICVNGHIAAFTLGEQLNNNTAVCHFEKADPFIEGLYQLINREFAKMYVHPCTYINREQDLGNAGLRNAKMSYHPLEYVRKYLITQIKQKDFVAHR